MYKKAFTYYLELEGGYSNHSSDRGGKTMYGVTEALAREHGYNEPMKDMTLETAECIIKKAFWDKFWGDKLDYEVAEKMLNLTTNQGLRTGIKHFQRALNLYEGINIKRDGLMGYDTYGAYKKVTDRAEGLLSLLKYLNVLQGYRYIRIIENDASQKAFTRGWTRRLK